MVLMESRVRVESAPLDRDLPSGRMERRLDIGYSK